MAITDHDIVDGIPHAMEAATKPGIEIIPGVELSSRFNGQELHVLGYCFDWQDPTFREHLARQRLSRRARIPQIIERLHALGIALSEDEVKAKAGSDSIGRPHVAQALVDKGYVCDTREAFDRYLGEEAAAYVPRTLADTRDVITWIRNAGGGPGPGSPDVDPVSGRTPVPLVRWLKGGRAVGLGSVLRHAHPETDCTVSGIGQTVGPAGHRRKRFPRRGEPGHPGWSRKGKPESPLRVIGPIAPSRPIAPSHPA